MEHRFSEKNPARIGVISDTHGLVDTALFQIFDGVSHILHAGDIGQDVLIQLESIAPVIAVKGNMDQFLTERKLHDVEIIKIHSKKILLTHIFGYPRRITPVQQKLLSCEKPHVVIFGHSHNALQESKNGVLYLNPGSAGPSRFAFKRSVALLTIGEDSVSATIIPLA